MPASGLPSEGMMLDAEAEFRRLVATARVLPTRFETEVVGRREPGVVAPEDFPAWTALRRAHWASALYEPAVVMLGEDRTVHGCMLLLRTLLELWAEFLYLTDKEDPVERRIRAIETEILVARELIQTLKVPGVASPIHADRSLDTAKARLARLETIKRTEKWKVTGRRYGQVETWLAKSGLEWPRSMYKGFSSAAHNFATEWAVTDETTQTWHFKATRLEQCVVIYGNIGVLAIELVQPAPDGSFRRAVEGLREDPVLQLALAGHLD